MNDEALDSGEVLCVFLDSHQNAFSCIDPYRFNHYKIIPLLISKTNYVI